MGTVVVNCKVRHNLVVIASRKNVVAVDRCDIVIVNFNAGRFLAEAEQSVLRYDPVAHIFRNANVNNGSTDIGLANIAPSEKDKCGPTALGLHATVGLT